MKELAFGLFCATIIHYDPTPLIYDWEKYQTDQNVYNITCDIITYSSFCKIVVGVVP